MTATSIGSTTQLISPIYSYQNYLTLPWSCSFKVISKNYFKVKYRYISTSYFYTLKKITKITKFLQCLVCRFYRKCHLKANFKVNQDATHSSGKTKYEHLKPSSGIVISAFYKKQKSKLKKRVQGKNIRTKYEN